MPSLRRVSDGAGDSGNMSMAIWCEDNGLEHNEQAARPRVGVALRVGSMSGRSYSYQDWWQTTIIQRILIDTPDYVKFETTNSTYEWWAGSHDVPCNQND